MVGRLVGCCWLLVVVFSVVGLLVDGLVGWSVGWLVVGARDRVYPKSGYTKWSAEVHQPETWYTQKVGIPSCLEVSEVGAPERKPQKNVCFPGFWGGQAPSFPTPPLFSTPASGAVFFFRFWFQNKKNN